MKAFVLSVLFALLVSVSSFAQTATPVPAPTVSASGVYFPGSAWTSTGFLSPVEKDNFTSQNYVEQGIGYKGVSFFGSLSVTRDSKGYDWNRRSTETAGVRLTQTIGGNGMVRVGVGYATEHRFVSGATASGVVGSVDAWFGWGNRKQ